MTTIKKFIIPVILLATVVSCKKNVYDVDTELDPNAPAVSLYLSNASKPQISQLAVGLQSVLRSAFVDFGRITGTVGREIIYSASTDNRYFTELLGTNVAQYTGVAAGANDPAGIFNTYYFAYSQTRRRAEQFIIAANNTSALTAAEKKGVEGFAKTIQAYVTLNLANMQGKNGIRETFTDLFDAGDLLKPGKFGTYATALSVCKKYADDGLAALNTPGVTFAFRINSGFGSFSSVTEFKKFNRAIAARIAMYQSDWAGMSAALIQSFLDLTGNLKTGPNFIFSTAANDITNGLFHVPNSSGAPFVAFNEVIANAEAGDKRIFPILDISGRLINVDTLKVGARNSSRQSGEFSSTHEVRMFAGNTSSASIIRNEELVLMYAEASAQTGAFPAAKAALDLIRTTYGLPAYSGALTTPALIDEVLKQRRYSLFFEGHRWFDMRRYNRLAQITPQGSIGGNNFVVFEAMSRPDAEVQWDIANP
jgi:starch-binding outer membrane protein, SusD/RagB family